MPSDECDEFLEYLAELVDIAENYLALAENYHMPLEMKIDALTIGLTEIRDKAKASYLDAGGEDVWDV